MNFEFSLVFLRDPRKRDVVMALAALFLALYLYKYVQAHGIVGIFIYTALLAALIATVCLRVFQILDDPSTHDSNAANGGEKGPSMTETGEEMPTEAKKKPTINGEKMPTKVGEEMPIEAKKMPTKNGEKVPTEIGAGMPTKSGEEMPTETDEETQTEAGDEVLNLAHEEEEKVAAADLGVGIPSDAAEWEEVPAGREEEIIPDEPEGGKDVPAESQRQGLMPPFAEDAEQQEAFVKRCGGKFNHKTRSLTYLNGNFLEMEGRAADHILDLVAKGGQLKMEPRSVTFERCVLAEYSEDGGEDNRAHLDLVQRIIHYAQQQDTAQADHLASMLNVHLVMDNPIPLQMVEQENYAELWDILERSENAKGPDTFNNGQWEFEVHIGLDKERKHLVNFSMYKSKRQRKGEEHKGE